MEGHLFSISAWRRLRGTCPKECLCQTVLLPSLLFAPRLSVVCCRQCDACSNKCLVALLGKSCCADTAVLYSSMHRQLRQFSVQGHTAERSSEYPAASAAWSPGDAHTGLARDTQYNLYVCCAYGIRNTLMVWCIIFKSTRTMQCVQSSMHRKYVAVCHVHFLASLHCVGQMHSHMQLRHTTAVAKCLCRASSIWP